MRVAICNKNINRLNALKLIIYRYAEKMKIEIMAGCYLCAVNMVASGVKYNMVFFDCDPNDIGWLKNAASIRESNNFCSIILLSSYANFTGDIFKIYPSDYLTYPVDELQVFRIFNEYFSVKGSNYPLLIKSVEETFCLNTNEIVYLEADNKYCVVHLEKTSFNCHKTMAYVYSKLPETIFLKINRSFVINSHYVNRFNNAELVLKNGKKLYISRNYYKNFKEKYCNYICSQQPKIVNNSAI